MIDIHKSFELTRFKLALVIIIISILVGVFLRFFDTIQASLEEVGVSVNLMSVQQMIHDRNWLKKGTDEQCNYLNDADLFIFAAGSSTSGSPGSWNYDPNKHQLTYYVRSTKYFRSNIGQKIVLELYCKEGDVLIKKNSYQWCNDKRLFGCGNW